MGLRAYAQARLPYPGLPWLAVRPPHMLCVGRAVHELLQRSSCSGGLKRTRQRSTVLS